MAEIGARIKVLFRDYLVLSYLFLHCFMLLNMLFAAYIISKYFLRDVRVEGTV